MRTIKLEGRLKELFGESFTLEIDTIAEGVRALCIIVPKFQEELSKGCYQIVAGAKSFDETELHYGLGSYNEVRLVPVIAGGGGSGRGIAKIVVGVVIIAAAWWTGIGAASGAALISTSVSTAGIGLGISIALSGVSSLLTPTPGTGNVEDIESPNTRPSFLFNGPVNVAEQGLPIPICAGRRIRRAGSVVVAAGIKVEQVVLPADEPFTQEIGYSYTGGGEYDSPNAFGGEDGGASLFSKYNDRYKYKLVDNNNTLVDLAGGEGGGGLTGSMGQGSDSGDQRTPVEEDDTLRNKVTGTVLDLISEGETGGLYQGLKSVFYNNVPVVNDDGSVNYKDVRITERFGTPTQDYIPGFNEVEREVAIGLKVEKNSPATYVHTDELLDSVRVTLRFPRMVEQTENGDVVGTSVNVRISMKSANTVFKSQVYDKIKGKTTSPYERSYRIQLSGEAPWTIKVERLSEDSDSIRVSNDVYLSRVTEIIEAKLSYPDCALIGQSVDPQPFNGTFPTRSFDTWGVKIQIPSNYDPETREYTGLWDGTFKIGITENPAWWFYALHTNTRWGLGQFIGGAYIDKWALYSIAQICDELVEDGEGGMEPRFRFNLQLNVQREGFKVLQALASVFRGMVFFGAGYVTAHADMPEDSTVLVTPSNVVDGLFTYIGTALATEFSVVHVAYMNPDDQMKVAFVSVEDEDYMQKLGYKPTNYVAYGCESKSQAIRTGRHILESQREGEVVNYVTGLDHASVIPGQIVKIADPFYAGVRYGGRTGPGSTQALIVLDDLISFDTGETYTIHLMYRSLEVGATLISVDSSDNSFNSTHVDFEEKGFQVGNVIQVTGFDSIINNSIFRVVSVSANKLQVNTDLMTEPEKSVDIESVSVVERRVLSTLVDGEVSAVILQQPLNTTPSAGTVWVLTNSKVDARPFRVVSNRIVAGDDTKFEITAILHDPNKLARIENKPVVDLTPYSQLPSGVLINPTELTVEIYNYLQDNSVNTAAILSWTPSVDTRVVLYQVMVLRPGATLFEHVAFTKGVSVKIFDVTSGNHAFRVRAFDALGQSTDWVVIEKSLASSGINGVQGFRSGLIGDQLHLSWDRPTDIELAKYELRYINVTSGALWSNSTVLLSHIPADTVSVVVPAMTGSYLIKAISVDGTYSKNAAVVALINAGITTHNVVLSSEDSPTWLGTKVDTVVAGTNLELDSDSNMDSWAALADVTSLRGYGMKTSGEYYISSVLDLGEVYTCRVSVLVVASGNNLLSNMDSWQRLSDITSLTGSDGTEYDVVVEYQSTDGDPSGTPTWSDWARYALGDYRARAYRFRLLLSTTLPEITPSISKFFVSLDMPDRVYGQNDVTCPVNGVTVDFSPKFKEVPVISITGQNMASGDRIDWTATRTQLNVEFFDSGNNSVLRTFDFIAKGFGQEA